MARSISKYGSALLGKERIVSLEVQLKGVFVTENEMIAVDGQNTGKIDAVMLLSGGLDSNVAAKLIADMGIRLLAVHFTGPFCQCNRGNKGCLTFARQLSDEIGIQFETMPLGEEYIDIVKSPKHGVGRGANPCVDCRIMMFKRAKVRMQELGARFIVTGEVLGQRPMSQMPKKLALIERESGLDGLILRPLSAKHLPPTIPEKEGWVDRSKLLAIHGRRRRQQMDLAEALDIGDYPCPSGGCLLTDKRFSVLIRDAIAHNELDLSIISRLKMGRHFRLRNDCRFILGRDEQENQRLKLMAGDDCVLEPVSAVGPTGILTGGSDENVLKQAMMILAGYCDGEGGVEVSALAPGRSPVNNVVERIDRSQSAASLIGN